MGSRMHRAWKSPLQPLAWQREGLVPPGRCTVRHSRRTGNWQMLTAHAGNLTLWRLDKSLLLIRLLKCNPCELKDQTGPPIPSPRNPDSRHKAGESNKRPRHHTVQNSNYLYFQKEKINIWKFPPVRRGLIRRERDGSYAGGKSGTWLSNQGWESSTEH